MKKRLRLLAWALTLTMLCELLPLGTFAQSDIAQTLAQRRASAVLDEENGEITNSGKCGEYLWWELFDDGTLTITGNGAMYNYDRYDEPWWTASGNITNIILDSGITHIGNFAFYQVGITSIQIPDTVRSIGHHAFSSCKSLSTITLPDCVTDIGYSAFAASGLTSIVLPDSLTSVSSDTFYNCTNLVSVALPSNLTSIGRDAFNSCNSLTSIFIPDSVTCIWARAFEDCHSLTSITIPESVTSIDSSTFANCYSLTSISLPSTLTSIGESAFFHCRALSSIDIPDSVTSIAESAFQGCSGLSSITIPDFVSKIDNYTFYGCNYMDYVSFPAGIASIGHGAFYNCDSLKDIYYTGTQEQWDAISIDYKDNDALLKAKIHYLSTEPDGDSKNCFTFKRDNLNFLNTRSAFFTNDELPPSNLGQLSAFEELWYSGVYPEFHYQLSSSKLQQLLWGLNPAQRMYIKIASNSFWTGSCHGMALVSMLHYVAPERLPLSRIPLSQEDASVSSIYNFKMPKDSTDVEDLINFYQLSQNLPTFREFMAERTTFCKEHTEEALDDILTTLEEGKPVLASLGSGGGHVIVLLNCYNEDEDSYYIKAYDPNSLDEIDFYIYKDSVSSQHLHASYNYAGHSYDNVLYYITSSEQDMQYLDVRNYFGLDDHESKSKLRWAVVSLPYDAVFDITCAGIKTLIRYGDYASNDPLFFLHSSNDTMDDDSPKNIQAFFPLNSDNSFSIDFSPANNGQFAIALNDTFLALSANAPISITYDAQTRSIDVTAEQKTSIGLCFTQDETSSSWPWNSWEIKTTNSTTLHAGLDNSGLHLSGDGISNAKYATENVDTNTIDTGTIPVSAESVTIVSQSDSGSNKTEIKNDTPPDAPGQYTVTVRDGKVTAINGISTDPAAPSVLAEKDDVITIEADDKSSEGKTFSTWNVTSNNVTLNDFSTSPAVFTMDAQNVTIQALYTGGDSPVTPTPGGGSSGSGSDSSGGGGDSGGAIIVGAAVVGAAVVAGVIMTAPVDIKGRIELADHTVVPGAKISLLREGNVVTQTTADENGNFVLKAKRGSYELTTVYTNADGQLIYKTIDIKAPAKDLVISF